MLTSRLMELIYRHAVSLTHAAVEDVLSNECTVSFRRIPRAELESRIATMFQNLSKWIGNSDEGAREEYEDWGRTRFRQGIPLSEIVYSVILMKHHLRDFIREHGQVVFSGDRLAKEMIGVELYSIQELNYLVGEFFDRALYHLARGYETAEKAAMAVA
jgi:hypothetical protein